MRGVFVCGYANNSANAGLSYSNANNSPTNANTNIGAQLNYNNNKYKICIDLTSW